MRQRRLKNEINVVPYIDVMLVLLVIFMVATPMMTTGSVELPAAGTAPQKPDKYLKVQVDKNGELSLFDSNGKERKLNGLRDLKTQLGDMRKGGEPLPVLIAGDRESPYKNVIEVLDEVKKLGFTRVALETAVK